mmetsp:Transcript_20204/g.42320  ORF Transcript_20204/g.42320 Transcript_20204/m.42320 type:complete len:123 (-) Transcript_20204:1929-2297(-)
MTTLDSVFTTARHIEFSNDRMGNGSFNSKCDGTDIHSGRHVSVETRDGFKSRQNSESLGRFIDWEFRKAACGALHCLTVHTIMRSSFLCSFTLHLLNQFCALFVGGEFMSNLVQFLEREIRQ